MPIVNTVERLVPSGASELTLADVEYLSANGPAKHQIQNIRDRHHAIARLLVLGYRHTEIAEMLGVTTVTVQNLLASPAFVAILEDYRERGADYIEHLRARTAGVAEEGLIALHRRFLDTAAIDKVPLNKLSEVTATLLDRAGVGPTRHHSHSLNLSREAIAAIKSGVEQYEYEDAEWSEADQGGDSAALPEGETQ